MNRNEAYERLTAHGIKPSVQRLAIMEYLISHNVHPTVEVVYHALIRKIPTLSVTTVYNTLRMFAEKGVAQMMTIDEHRVCYDGITEPHVHFYCKQCGRVLDMMDEQMPMPTAEVDGNRIDEVHLYYKGICRECAAKNQQ